MCGIFGYVGKKPCASIIYQGLEQLEYRGYDSSGICISFNGESEVIKTKGRVCDLKPLLSTFKNPNASLGMGHTRWATHGEPSTINAHPHTVDSWTIVHNGIIENYQELKVQLEAKGSKFKSQTDTEVILHLIYQNYLTTQDLKTALLQTLEESKGLFAIGLISPIDPDAIYLMKRGSPLVIGLTDEENLFASDAIPLSKYTNQVIFLEDNEIVRLTKNSLEIWDKSGFICYPKIQTLDLEQLSTDKGTFEHYMLKEIYEQPEVLSSTIQRYFSKDGFSLDETTLGIENLNLEKINRIHIVACGTAYYAGLIGKYALEQLARIPTEVELASEFHNKIPCVDEKTLVIAITQSGETIDTLLAAKKAKELKAQILSICNVKHSSIPRMSHATMYMEAGSEVGVASTKAFVCMAFNLYTLALALGQRSRVLTHAEVQQKSTLLRQLPLLCQSILDRSEEVKAIAKKYHGSSDCLFLGRGLGYPVALEGALKLKELSYIHAEGYAAGELKHGPIALVDENMPVVILGHEFEHLEKLLSNAEEVRARKGLIIGVGNKNYSKFSSLCEDFFDCPQLPDPYLQSILSTLPLQLFAYYIAWFKGLDIDKPRNLAKSVTVE